AVARHQALVSARGQDDFADIDVAVRIDAQVVRGEEIARRAGIAVAAEPREELSFKVKDAQAGPNRGTGRRLPGKQSRAPADLGHEHAVMTVDDNLHWPGHVGPRRQKLAVGREDLNAAILAVRHEYPSGTVQGDAMRQIELARPASRLTPG